VVDSNINIKPLRRDSGEFYAFVVGEYLFKEKAAGAGLCGLLPVEIFFGWRILGEPIR